MTVSTKNRGFGLIVVLIAAGVLALIVGGGWYAKQKGIVSSKIYSNILQNVGIISQEKKVCTQEAKLCPDGTAVGRTGPNCEFTECPNVSNKQQETGNRSDTPGWKTYRSSGYGYSIDYPANYFLKTANADCFDATAGDSDAPSLCIFVDDNAQRLSLRSWWSAQGNNTLKEAAPIIVDGQTALVFESKPETFPERDIIFALGSKVYRIVSNTVYEDRMIASFRILIDTSTWKTYRNQKYGFEARWPWNVAEKEGELLFLDKMGGLYIRVDKAKTELQTYCDATGCKMHIIQGQNTPISLKFLEDATPIGEIKLTSGTFLHFLVSHNASPDDTQLYNQFFSTIKLIPQLDTSTWKTYRNEKYGFEVKYPLDWSLSEISTNESIGISSPERYMLLHNLGAVDVTDDIFINVLSNPEKLSLEEFIKNLEDGWYTTYAAKELSIAAGKKAISFDDSGAKIGHAPFYVTFIDSGQFVLITGLSDYTSRGSTQNIPILNGILSTLKFIR